MKFIFYCLLLSLPFALLQMLAVFVAFQRHEANRYKMNLLRALCWIIFFLGVGLVFYFFNEYHLWVKIGLFLVCYLLGRVIFQILFTIYLKKVIDFDEE